MHLFPELCDGNNHKQTQEGALSSLLTGWKLHHCVEAEGQFVFEHKSENQGINHDAFLEFGSTNYYFEKEVLCLSIFVSN